MRMLYLSLSLEHVAIARSAIQLSKGSRGDESVIRAVVSLSHVRPTASLTQCAR